jgi:hypothetical protein
VGPKWFLPLLQLRRPLETLRLPRCYLSSARSILRRSQTIAITWKRSSRTPKPLGSFTLEQRVLHYKATFNEPLIGYILNNGKVSDFHIPVGGRLYQEAKWVQLNDDGTISGYLSTQGSNEQPHIIDLYVAPDYSINLPTTALSTWFHHMLTRPGGNFRIL